MLIAITGKSGSGKSTLAKEYAKELPNCIHIDVDKVSHEVLETIKNDLVDIYGDIILREDGAINRVVLGDLIFSDRVKYDALVRPVWERVLVIVDRLVSSHTNAVIDHILVAHTKYWEQADITIKVICNEDKRIARIKKRDNISDDYLVKREAASPDFDSVAAMMEYYSGQ